MRFARLAVASLAAVAVLALGAVVALAAPAAVAQVAAPSASAAQAQYCPPGEKARRQRALTSFKRQLLPQRRAYYRTHPRPAQRRAFVQRQQVQLKALQRAFARCE